MKVVIPKRLTVFLIIALTCLPLAAYSAILSVEVTPHRPTSEDVVDIEVSGEFNDMCWSVSDHEFTVAGNLITITINAVDAWDTGVDCPMVLSPYTVVCNLGNLDAGRYTVEAIETHSSLRDPTSNTVIDHFRVMRRVFEIKIPETPPPPPRPRRTSVGEPG